MRAILLILAAYAFVGWNDANAACQRFKPDGTVEACRHMAPGAAAEVTKYRGHSAHGECPTALQGLVELLEVE